MARAAPKHPAVLCAFPDLGTCYKATSCLTVVPPAGYQAVRYYSQHDSIPTDELLKVQDDLKTKGAFFREHFR